MKTFNETLKDAVWFLYGQELDILAEGNVITIQHVRDIAKEASKRYASQFIDEAARVAEVKASDVPEKEELYYSVDKSSILKLKQDLK